MVFSSPIFLFIFLPVTYLGYRILPGLPLRNAWLTLASLVFFSFGQLPYLVLLLISVLIVCHPAQPKAEKPRADNDDEHQQENLRQCNNRFHLPHLPADDILMYPLYPHLPSAHSGHRNSTRGCNTAAVLSPR